MWKGLKDGEGKVGRGIQDKVGEQCLAAILKRRQLPELVRTKKALCRKKDVLKKGRVTNPRAFEKAMKHPTWL
ncbi:hypothetical protein J6590_020794 [Homalodisca vitripennis]|nr:hypothetical protein J6590_020794 [Homalodisca vitripennis]